MPNPTAATNLALPFRTTKNGQLRDGLRLNPSGAATLLIGLTVGTDLSGTNSLNVTGQVDMGWVQVHTTATISSDRTQSFYISCPAGTRLLGDGGNVGTMVMNSSGPDPSFPATRWRIIMTGSSQGDTMHMFCNCARV